VGSTSVPSLALPREAPRTRSRTALIGSRTARLGRLASGLMPGLLLVGAVSLTAHLIAVVAFPYALAVGFEVPLAMLLGLIVVNLGGATEWAAPGIRFAVKYVLGLGIVLLGLRLNLQSIGSIGIQALGLVVLTIGGACTFAVLVGRRIGVETRVALLIGLGSSVCGNSAIAAAAPMIKANEREVSFAIATITIFGTAAVFLFPLVGHALGLDVLTFGLWSGSSVPDTAQTVATGAAYSTVARDVATVVKLVRNLLIVPLLLLIACGWNRWGDDEISTQDAKRSMRKAFPIFLVGFLALAVVRTARWMDPEQLVHVDALTRACFVMALAGFGLQTPLGHIRAMGAKPFVLGLGTASLLAAGSLTLILALGIGPARTEVAGAVDPRPLGAWTPVCDRGDAYGLAGAFVGLSDRLGQRIGKPVGCAQVNAGTGDTSQRTSNGVATLSGRTGQVSFSNGHHTWSLPVVPARAQDAPAPAPLHVTQVRGHVLATGIPGAGALSPVGTFHPGGPMHDNRNFAATTQPGEVLDPTRLLVASTSNFGAPTARAGWDTGSILSLGTGTHDPLVVPADFAASGGQADAVGGAVKLYTAQSRAFLNRGPNAGAVTAAMPAVSNPLGISVNNAFGRPWFANAPHGDGTGMGTESVLDPGGQPLSEDPDERAGGVFAGAATNRDPQLVPGGLTSGAVGNALLGASPDTRGRAVFAVATADGGLAQINVEKGVDGLAPPGTLAPLTANPDSRSGSPSRVGMAFNWIPDRYLYVTDPGNDAVLQLQLDDDYEVFHVVASRRLASPYFSDPVDLAPAVEEVANPAFASNTTLAGGADMYVANRGSGEIVRMRQDGRIRAVAKIHLPGGGVLGEGRLNGIAVSPDAKTIWASISGARGASGSVIALPAFGAPR
jgi:uncharacterized integral membrane protein (TIGR00698 family)